MASLVLTKLACLKVCDKPQKSFHTNTNLRFSPKMRNCSGYKVNQSNPGGAIDILQFNAFMNGVMVLVY